jgi:hypothetical protein
MLTVGGLITPDQDHNLLQGEVICDRRSQTPTEGKWA